MSKMSKKTKTIIATACAFLVIAGFGVIKAIQNKNNAEKENSTTSQEENTGNGIDTIKETLSNPKNESETIYEFGLEIIIKEDGRYIRKENGELKKIADKKIIPLTGKWELAAEKFYEFREDNTFTISIPFEYEGKTCYTYYNGTFESTEMGENDYYYFLKKVHWQSKKMLFRSLGLELEFFTEENVRFVEMYYDNITSSENDLIFYENGLTDAETTDSTFCGMVVTCYNELNDRYEIAFKPNTLDESFVGIREVKSN